MHVSLKQGDTEHNMDRWYAVHVQPALLDSVAVVCAWGSRRSRYHRLRVVPASSYEEAYHLAEELVRKKMQRGYCGS